MNAYRILRAGWRLIPEGIRSSSWLRAIIQPMAGLFREHKQGIYHSAYFEQDVVGPAVASAKVIADSVCREFNPRRFVDIGCGSGALLAELNSRGVETRGLEYSDAAREVARTRGVDAQPFDVRFDTIDPAMGEFDVACSTEVAEHLPAKFADRLVSTLTHAAKHVVFTAATPGQGGTDHVNEQPHEYWIAKFRDRGFNFDGKLSDQWREEWKHAGVATWYWKNVMIFSSDAVKR